MALRLVATPTLGAILALSAIETAPAGEQATPTLRIVGFASTLSVGGRAPRVQTRDGGTITTCLDKRALSAIFVIGNVPAGSSYQQYWSSKGKTVLLGKTSILSSGIGAPKQVHMGFRKKAALKNGRYIFQFILSGRPHVLGGVTRKC
jgi:hypothetical protein